MFIEIAAILWAFNISPAKDEDGKVTLPDVDDCVDEGLVVYVIFSFLYCWSVASLTMAS